MRPTAGTFLGPYQINALLGIGGMAEVWRARDTHLDRDVAVKVLAERFSADAIARERLVREARASAALNHRNVCTLYDIGAHEGRDYLVMEYFEGETLAGRLARGALPVPEAIAVARDIVAALDHAHRHGVIHRDVKPSNVMLTANGARLLDFGLASLRGPAVAPQDRRLTLEGALVGTIDYTSPEQLTGGLADARSDIFSFGVVLYEMLAGQRPFTGGNRASIMGAILLGHPRPDPLVSPLPSPVRRIVLQCLEKDMEKRPQSAADLMSELDGIPDLS